MAKERKKSEAKQITFRLSDDLHDRLEATAKGMSLDTSSLLRLMIRTHLPTYEQQAEEIKQREGKKGRG